MSQSTSPIFSVFSYVTAIPSSNGKLILAERLVSGMEEHGKYWPGRMLCLCEPAPEAQLTENRDRALAGSNIEVSPSDLNFELVVADFFSAEAKQALARSAVTVVGLGYRANHIAAWGNELGVPVIYGSEYSLKTRLQIEMAEGLNPIVLARRFIWQLNLERKQRSAVRRSAGIQCVGTPTYDAYKDISPNAMLFFDSRMTDDMLVADADQARRHARLRSGRPLRLAWSGRLNKMKGAHHLPAFAAALKALGVPFTFEVFGGGVLEADLRRDVVERGLADCVEIKGFVNFAEVLTPYMQKEVDLWVCPHVQGDPSGAFLETMGNGVPIIGFDTEALTGMLRMVDAGRTVRLGDARALAAAAAEASRQREQLVQWSIAARAFAAEHTFEKSFQRRMVHIDEVLAAQAR